MKVEEVLKMCGKLTDLETLRNKAKAKFLELGATNDSKTTNTNA